MVGLMLQTGRRPVHFHLSFSVNLFTPSYGLKTLDSRSHLKQPSVRCGAQLGRERKDRGSKGQGAAPRAPKLTAWSKWSEGSHVRLVPSAYSWNEDEDQRRGIGGRSLLHNFWRIRVPEVHRLRHLRCTAPSHFLFHLATLKEDTVNLGILDWP